MIERNWFDISFCFQANKKDLEKALENHPDIVKIDHHIKELNDELKQLGDR